MVDWDDDGDGDGDDRDDGSIGLNYTQPKSLLHNACVCVQVCCVVLQYAETTIHDYVNMAKNRETPKKCVTKSKLLQ